MEEIKALIILWTAEKVQNDLNFIASRLLELPPIITPLKTCLQQNTMLTVSCEALVSPVTRVHSLKWFLWFKKACMKENADLRPLAPHTYISVFIGPTPHCAYRHGHSPHPPRHVWGVSLSRRPCVRVEDARYERRWFSPEQSVQQNASYVIMVPTAAV